jgi:cysteine-rich repeat protein
VTANPTVPTAGRNSRASRFAGAVLTIALAVALVFVDRAHATPGPVGPEYAAEERPIPAGSWWTTCSDADGVSVSVRVDCDGAECDQPAHVVAERVDDRGRRLGREWRVTQAPVEVTDLRVVCHASGSFVVSWVDDDTSGRWFRVFAAGGDARGPAAPLPSEELCPSYRPSLAVDASGRITMACLSNRDRRAIVAAAFSPSGDQTSEAVTLSQSVVSWETRPKLAVDDAGTVLVAWQGDRERDGSAPILARFLHRTGRALGDEFRMTGLDRVSVSEPAVHALATGLFEVLWGHPLQGGRVGRRVAIDADAIEPSTTTTTLPLALDVPAFGATRTIDTYVSLSGEDHAPRVVLTDHEVWGIGENRGRFRRSTDAATVWSEPTDSHAPGRGALAVATDGDGVWAALHAGAETMELEFSRSTDDGATWLPPGLLARTRSVSPDCERCEVPRAALAAGGNGTWLAGWSTRDRAGNGDQALGIHVSRSGDGGSRWAKPITVATDDGAGSRGFGLATDGDGTWIVVWADADIKIVRSTNDGGRFTRAETIVVGATCAACASHARYDRVEIATDGAGTWLVIFASPLLRVDDTGYDSDIFVVRSVDDGATWSEPQPIATYAATDGARELDPAITFGSHDRWLATWTSHRSQRGGDDLDADIVAAASADGGLTWSAPGRVDPYSIDDAAIDRTPHVAASKDGAWLLSWQSRPATVHGELVSDRLHLAAADAVCGDGLADVGEQCDERNDADGDGCDSNCTLTACGNGIVTVGEQCDDANRRDDDACVGECKPATCGDGFLFALFEECDDGNSSDDDDCTSRCAPPRCGDGLVRASVEQCDDGNSSNGDRCTAECVPARCGDGHQQAHVEQCDDGNTLDGDYCPADCGIAVCGDGELSPAVEECDWANPEQADVCTKNCRLVDICGDANGDGQVTVSDARRILTSGIGIAVSCPPAVCDMDRSGAVRVPDAQMGLGVSVGLDVGEPCSLGTGDIVFWTHDPRTMGALQLEIDYSVTGGSFAGSGVDTACEPVGIFFPADDVGEEEGPALDIVAFNNLEEQSLLHVGIVSITGFSGPLDLFRCRFTLDGEVPNAGFSLRVVDASTPSTDPLEPRPQVGYRLE